jgi:glutathione S-transferase
MLALIQFPWSPFCITIKHILTGHRVRHKKRKFGRGCVQEWTSHRRYLCAQFTDLLKPIDDMLAASPFLLTDRPLFVDYNLYGVLGNYLFNGKRELPNLRYLRRWHQRMNTTK